MGISSAGIGSGLDVESIVTQLMAVEQKPLQQLQSQASSYNTRLSAYGTLKSAVSTLQSAMQSLTSSSTGFASFSASTSSAAIASATVSGKAAAGSYTIQVSQLAQQQKLTSAGIADSSTALGSGTLEITVGDGDPVTISPTDYSLMGIRDAINRAAAGVTATVVHDGSENGYRLVLTADSSGAANTIKISASDSSLAQFAYDPEQPVSYDAANPPSGMSQLQEGRDAKLTVDGLSITKSSNQITDAIQGLTLKLSDLSKDTPVTLTVSRDTTTVKNSINSFVKAYNALNQSISSLTAYNATTKVAGALQGDSTANGILNQIRAELTKAVDGAGSLATLNDLGISLQKDGSLKLDDTKLQNALDKNFDSIATLFNGENGYATRLVALTKDILADDGAISARTKGLNESIKSNTKRQETEQDKLDAIEARYRKQYAALDTALASMQNTSTYLTQQLAALSASSN